jgi:L-asparaginase / beta-aspartyl-peptidase
LPNIDGHVQLDAAYMDGDTLDFGGIIEVEDIKSPIAVAQDLCGLKCNCLLSGKGAESYAKKNGFPFENHLCESSKKRWEEKKKEDIEELQAYEGHDTVCVLGKVKKHLGVGVSTSGLFMKQEGRVGDSPIIGSGFYADSLIGCAAATGLGEDIMRGCLSLRVVDKMAEGKHVQEAVNEVLDAHIKRMALMKKDCDAISLIAMDKNGNCAASTNIGEFPFVVLQDNDIKLFVATYKEGMHNVFEADETWLKQYKGD